MSNNVVHFEILGTDAKKSQDFYAKLFGWNVDANNPMNYGLVRPAEGSGGIGGGIGANPDGKPMVAFYVGVDDIHGMLKKAESMGSQVLMPVTTIPGMVTFAMFADPDGNAIGLVDNKQPA